MLLSEKKISVSSVRMGRPSLGEQAGDTQATIVRFEKATLTRIDAALLPGEKRAALIRIAVEAEIKRRKA